MIELLHTYYRNVMCKFEKQNVHDPLFQPAKVVEADTVEAVPHCWTQFKITFLNFNKIIEGTDM
jgi:hypothetical protein